MNNEDLDFISGTETCRSISNLCFIGAVIFLISHEFGLVESLLNWAPTMATPIVLSLLGVGLRVTAIDRFLRMSRQSDSEASNSNYGE